MFFRSLSLIPANRVPDGKLCVEMTFGFSNVASALNWSFLVWGIYNLVKFVGHG